MNFRTIPLLSLLTIQFSLALSLCCRPVTAQSILDVLPSHARDPSIPTPEEYFGFAVGSRHLRHDQVVDYFRHLGQVSDRVEIQDYARSHGERPLLVACVSSPENIQRLAKLQKQRPLLTRGTDRAESSERLMVMYMGYCVHGDEASAVNAAPAVLYHLASSLSDEVQGWLSNSVYLVDPALNPDGVDRFANWANENRGRFPSASSADREHVQPWPGGRTNYYWFDLNRDWLPQVHPESRGRVALFHRWKPNVVLDFHEMSGSASYFFQPGIPARNNPFSPRKNLELTRLFAREHAAILDDADELYFTEERFDDFYPGKGSTYPDLHGALGILFEQGSTRGLRLRNSRTNRHFRDTVANQVRTSLSSLTAAAKHRTGLFQLQTGFYRNSLQEAEANPQTAYILTGTASRISAAANLLSRHKILAYTPAKELVLEGQGFSAREALILPTRQPEYLFLKSLMEPLQSFRENIFYDVSTWHLPSAFDISMHRWSGDLPETWTSNRWKPTSEKLSQEQASEAEESRAAIGFVFSPVELPSPKLAVSLQLAGASMRVTNEPMRTNDGKTWPRGSYLLLKQPNLQRWTRLATKCVTQSSSLDITIGRLESGMTPKGPDLGSSSMSVLPQPNPLLVVGPGTRAYSAGALWHHLDTRLGLPATLVEDSRLNGVDLREFTTVILPEGSYQNWGDAHVEALKDYLRSGGTVVAISSSARWLSQKEILGAGQPEAASSKTPALAGRFGDAQNARALESIAGAFFSTTVDPTHPLAYGFPDAVVPVFRDHSLRFVTPENPYGLAANYTNVIAGYVSERNRKRLRGSAAVWAENVGSGRVICIADNPVFRGYVRGSERFLTNAVLLGPTLRVPSSPIADNAEEVEGHGHHH